MIFDKVVRGLTKWVNNQHWLDTYILAAQSRIQKLYIGIITAINFETQWFLNVDILESKSYIDNILLILIL